MIEILNIEFNGISGTFDAAIDGQRIEGCRALIARQHGKITAIPPQSASELDWGDHTLADLSDELVKKINDMGN